MLHISPHPAVVHMPYSLPFFIYIYAYPLACTIYFPTLVEREDTSCIESQLKLKLISLSKPTRLCSS